MIRVFMILLVLTGSAVLGADRFQVCEEIVIDTATGFQWTAAPDRHMEWADAVEWVAGLGEEWRLPLMDELAGLFEAGVTDLDWGAFEDYGRMDAWSLETDSSGVPRAFNFYEGVPVVPPPDASPSPRVFAVRTPPEETSE